MENVDAELMNVKKQYKQNKHNYETKYKHDPIKQEQARRRASYHYYKKKGDLYTFYKKYDIRTFH